jgi:long-chain fatty acid transport protein
VGWLGQLTDRLSVGVSAQTKTYMSEFDDYEGLFAEQGDFDVPPVVTAGLSFKATPAITIVFDWQRIFYGEVNALGNSNTSDFLTDPKFRLGADDGLGFGWDNINIYKLGVQWAYNPKLTLRIGVSHADKLFDNGEALFNILAPATIRTHASIGFTYEINPKNSISASYTHAFNEKIKGQSPLTGSQTGYVEMNQNELEISWGRTFD